MHVLPFPALYMCARVAAKSGSHAYHGSNISTESSPQLPKLAHSKNHMTLCLISNGNTLHYKDSGSCLHTDITCPGKHDKAEITRTLGLLLVFISKTNHYNSFLLPLMITLSLLASTATSQVLMGRIPFKIMSGATSS